MLRITPRAFAFAAAMLVGGCATAPKLEPKGEVVAAVPTDGTRPRVTCKLLNLVRVELPAVRHAGDGWTLILNDERYLDQRGPVVSRADGTATVPFLAMNPGRRPIRFAELPPDQKEADPVQLYEIVVTIE